MLTLLINKINDFFGISPAFASRQVPAKAKDYPVFHTYMN